MPISGAPRTARRRIASAVSSAPVSESHASSNGRRVWSRTLSARPSQRRAANGWTATAMAAIVAAPRPSPAGSTLAEPVLDAQRPRRRVRARGRLRWGGGGRVDPEGLVQLAALVHLADDVAAADELAVDEELRDRRPARQRRQLLADARVGQDVDRGERRAGGLQGRDGAGGGAARRHLGRALHEEDDAVLADRLGDRVAEGVLGLLGHAKLLRGGGLHAQGVNRAADLAGEDVHHEPVLLDAAQAREHGRDHGGAKVVAATGPVLDVSGRIGDRGLDALLDLQGGGHLVDTG